ncbi:YidB family protein [Rhodoblastus acidophilus]|uniref:YidB family protein n=1 Tax=Candidatus Rhodoblastus alkanivorans TaxID=2954117 RepID=A0ABS9Z6C5_9HYPH|nr:YidB family protein [Candidatus Rhodoblastus alkanivorans]MCI4679146.1 YidB family protein [Candidatus Rhodoblastus alkanivorans]MCI4683142.1 YidB family protein [Candidatus Rhodoblastus alkanivorans]MDI4640453.1 YidB family protein [Rhodoblastus acidophilus]
MGLLDDAVSETNKAVPGGDFTKPLLIAAGALILGHFFGRGKQDAPVPAPEPAPQQQPPASGGGLFGQLGGMLSGVANSQLGGALAGAASGAAVSGGLGSLLEQFRNAGLGQQANSWVGTGQNQPITADQINSVIGQGKIAEIAQQAGIDPAQMSQLLAQALPHLIDKLTPGGQLPQS